MSRRYNAFFVNKSNNSLCDNDLQKPRNFAKFDA